NELPPHVSQLPADFSPQIDQVVQQALAKSPQDRPGSAMAMAMAFHAALTGDKSWTPPVSVTPHHTPPNASATKKLPLLNIGASNTRWLLIAAGFAALILVIMAGLVFLGRPAGAPSVTQAPSAGSDVVQVAPVAEDENMVLVAQPEQL